MSIGFTVKSTDNAEKIQKELSSKLKGAMVAVGLKCEGFAKDLVPVDTGRLKGSISSKVEDTGKEYIAYVGSNVEYAPYVELGTSRQAAKPYLRPAAEGHGSEYRKLIQEYIKGL